MTAGRLSRLSELAREAGMDAVIVTDPVNVRWLTGFAGMHCSLCIGEDRPLYLASLLYVEDARAAMDGAIAVEPYTGKMFASLAERWNGFAGRRVGYEEDVLTCSQRDALAAAAPDAALVPAGSLISGLRMKKDPADIAAITRAQRIAEAALGEVFGLFREGVAERELAAELDYRMRLAGSERPAFETIVAFGPHTSMPHAVPCGRRLAAGDAVLVDLGAVCDGYASDMTRTAVFGEPDPEFARVYGTVLRAQEAALAGITAGMACAAADALARDVIEAAGWGDRFVHSLGHGVGMEVHERPRLAKTDDTVLETGMVVTVEPGIYLPGRFGVRIEDLVVVTDSGCVNLTRAPSDLVRL